MSAATVSVNKKLPDGTLISIGGTDAQDLEANLQALLPDSWREVLDQVQAAFNGQPAAPAQDQFAQAQANVQAAFPQAAPAPAAPPGAPVCDHGRPREYKQGEKNGRAWKAWFCTHPDRNAQCPAKWVR